MDGYNSYNNIVSISFKGYQALSKAPSFDTSFNILRVPTIQQALDPQEARLKSLAHSMIIHESHGARMGGKSAPASTTTLM